MPADRFHKPTAPPTAQTHRQLKTGHELPANLVNMILERQERAPDTPGGRTRRAPILFANLEEVDTTGTWVYPEAARAGLLALLLAAGGGGQRGSADNIIYSSTTDSADGHTHDFDVWQAPVGGAGGGAGQAVLVRIQGNPGDTLNLTIGAAGAGGSGSNHAAGSDGGDTRLYHTTTSLINAYARGGGGGGTAQSTDPGHVAGRGGGDNSAVSPATVSGTQIDWYVPFLGGNGELGQAGTLRQSGEPAAGMGGSGGDSLLRRGGILTDGGAWGTYAWGAGGAGGYSSHISRALINGYDGGDGRILFFY